MSNKLEDLQGRLREIDELRSAAAALHWDLATHMPAAGGTARGRQLATLKRLAHERLTAPEIGRLLDGLERELQDAPHETDEASLIRVTRRDYERARQIPSPLLTELHTHSVQAYQAWAEARANEGFARVQPYLEKTLELSRQLADCYPGYEHIADPLIDLRDPEMKVATLRPLFAELKAGLQPMVEAIAAQPAPDTRCLYQPYAEADQLRFAHWLVAELGYDFTRGRLDTTLHPFATRLSADDVRITTRVREGDLSEALFSTLHEAGHALYEQGVDPALEGTPLARGASVGVHESQARLWENLVGRSRGFWRSFYPQLQSHFPEQLGAAPLETFYQAINKVTPSVIRTEADEVTYNLHVIIRFELELELLEGRLAIKDLPEAWRARYQEDLGVTPQDEATGVLQDVHWFSNHIGGMFQGYTLGNLLSAMFYEAALRDCPSLSQELEAGQGKTTLYTWLHENLYRHGRKFTPTELLDEPIRGPLTPQPFLRYLRTKYTELYGLDLS